MKYRDKAPLVAFFGSVYENTNHQLLATSLKSIHYQKKIKKKIFVFVDGEINYKIERVLKLNKVNIFRCFSKKKNGLGFALNFLVDKIKNENFEYFSRFDDDDYFDNYKTCEQIDYMKKNNIDICGTWAIENSHFNFFKSIPIKDKDLKRDIFFRSPFIHSSVIFKKKVLKKFNYCKEFKKLQDYELWFRISNYGSFKFGNIPSYSTFMNISENFYHKRGKLIAIKEFLLRCNNIRLFDRSFFFKIFYALLVLIIRIGPKSLRKYVYKNYR